MARLLDYLQAASNAAASNVSGPVDLINAGLLGIGLPMPANPVGGSRWMAERGLTREVADPYARVVGETAGLLAPVVVAAKAPQIAEGLLALRPVPSGSGMTFARDQAGAVKPEAVQQALEQWRAAKAGEHVPSQVRKGLVLTDSQLEEINRAYANLTGGRQPPAATQELDIATGHIFDARMSGRVKPSGKVADSFPPDEVARWLPVAGADDAAVALNRDGKPYLTNVYVDPRTGERVPLEMPISGDSSGKLWASGLVPRGKRSPSPR